VKKLANILIGLGSILDLTGRRQLPRSYYETFEFDDLPSHSDPDLDVIAKDWAVVGRDMYRALERFEQEHPSIGKV
jgi:hypothetical protein